MSKFFSRFFASIRNQAGFTMIELLIVISILGFLAIAVLAAINPIEQINRGRDTGSRSDAEQLLSAMDRYYAFNGYYPWQTGAADTDAKGLTDTIFINSDAFADANGCEVAQKLSTYTGADTANCAGSDELKTTFITRVSEPTYQSLHVFNRGTQGDSTYVCFKPQSKAFLDEATKRCGVGGAGLPADISASDRAVVCAEGEILSCLP